MPPPHTVRSNSTKLLDAIKRGDLEAVDRLLKKRDVDVNARDERGRSALALAVGKNSRQMVNWLVNRGADVSGNWTYSMYTSHAIINMIEEAKQLKEKAMIVQVKDAARAAYRDIFLKKGEGVELTTAGRPRDGTVYAGVSPDTGKPMYTTPQDEPQAMSWYEAQARAAEGNWRLPTKRELNVLFNSRAVVGGFDATGQYPLNWYWSSSSKGNDNANAWGQNFSNGSSGYGSRKDKSSTRFVRG